MKIDICIPSRCTAKLEDDLNSPHLIGEEKLDGSRYVFYIGNDPYNRHTGNTLLSRRLSTKDKMFVDRTMNVPHITQHTYSEIEGTVIDGEIVAKDFLTTNSIMNSLPAEAERKQKETGLCNYRVFDIMYYCYRDVRDLPLSERRKLLEDVILKMNNPHVTTIKQVKGDLHTLFENIINSGGEGIIVKDIRKPYGVGWAKMKKSYDVSCVISGFKPGIGKYESSVGSMALSVYHEDELVEVGFASGFNDEIRADMTKNPDNYIGKVVDIFTQEIQKSNNFNKNQIGRLRHPTFYRFRDDMNPKDCTSKKLCDDIASAKTRNSRKKNT